MIEIIVKRPPADRQCPTEISDPLITSIPVAQARGRAEINRSCSDRKQLAISAPLMPRLMPGAMVGITSASPGRRVGKLKSFYREYQSSGNNFTGTCNLTVEVVDDKQ